MLYLIVAYLHEQLVDVDVGQQLLKPFKAQSRLVFNNYSSKELLLMLLSFMY